MCKMRKMLHSRLRLFFGKKVSGSHGEDDMNSPKGNKSLTNEYDEAFSTKSYTDLCNKVHHQHADEGHPFSPYSSHSPHHHSEHLSEYLLDPSQETIASIIKGSGIHHFLVNSFDKSREAGEMCECILQNIHQASINHRPIRNLTEQFPDPTRWTHNQFEMLQKNLAYFSTHNNPFSSALEKFLELHDSHIQLLHQLMSEYKKMKRMAKFIKYVKRIMKGFLLVGSGTTLMALLVLVLVLVAHSMVGMVAPGLILGFLMIKKLKGRKKKSKKRGIEGQLDVAARGVYTLINDLDTMRQLVNGLHSEVERRKLMAGNIVKRGKDGMLKEMVMNVKSHELWFNGQVEELKRHVLLCFLNINRARRLLVQEIV